MEKTNLSLLTETFEWGRKLDLFIFRSNSRTETGGLLRDVFGGYGLDPSPGSSSNANWHLGGFHRFGRAFDFERQPVWNSHDCWGHHAFLVFVPNQMVADTYLVSGPKGMIFQ